MKKILLLPLMIGYISVNAQNETAYKTSGFSSETFHYLVNREFSKLVTGQSTIGVGTYASLDVQKTEATFSPSIGFKNGNILNFTFKGGATDGVSSVFNYSKLNTNLSFELQYNTLGKKFQTIYFDSETLRNYKADSTKICTEYNRTILELECLSQLNTFYVEIEKLNKVIKESQSEIDNLNTALKSTNDETIIALISARINFIDCQKKIYLENLKLYNTKIAEYHNDATHEEEKTDKMYKMLSLNNKKAKNLEDLRSKLEITGVAMYWFSFSYKIRNDAFKLLDPTETFADQVKKKDYISHEFKSQFTLYHHTTSKLVKTLYLAAALTYKYKSNYLDLSKLTVTDTQTVGSSGTAVREISNNYIAYQGDYKTGVNQVDMDIDFYCLFFNKNLIGIHVFPNSQFKEDLKPSHNLGIGIVLPFKDKTKEASIINAELYYNILNVFNSEDSNKSLLERNDIGFRFTFPFNF